MSHRQAIRHIGSYIVKREWLGVLVTFLFALYTGGFMSFSVNSLAGDEELPGYLSGLVDWIYLTMFPCFGLLMNKTAFAMWKEDVYSKRIAHWLTMPIPLSAIVQVRVLQTVVMLPVIGVSFLLFQYILAPELRAAVSMLEWLETGIIWICYAFIIDALYTLVEFGYGGKQNVIFYLAFMAVTLVVTVVLTWQGVHIFQAVLDQTVSGQSALFIVLLIIMAVLATWMGYRATLSRLSKRSLTF